MADPSGGPLVRRAVHRGAALWLVAALQFVVAMIVVQLAWSGPPAYSLSKNYISDLGNTGCGPWPDATSPRVCSPWHEVFDASSIVLGLLVLLGAVLVRTGFLQRRESLLGLGLIALSGLGAIGVGLSPENVNLSVHTSSALVAFVSGNLALVALGAAIFHDARWTGFGGFTAALGVIGIAAFALFDLHRYLGLGVGGMERLIVAPLLLFLVVGSVRLLRLHQFAPPGLPGTTGT
jgi:hypothetical membrane protein